MVKFKFLAQNKLEKLPKNNGVYCFLSKGKTIYIGKAANIKERVKDHFNQPSYRDNLFLNKITKIGYIETDSEIEALILEAELIKKYQPKFNVVWRDDKNYFFVAINKNKNSLPYVFITHQPNKLKIDNWKLEIDFVGPFIDGNALKQTLKYLRKVFPYYSTKNHPKTLCPWCHLSLCPGPNANKQEYKRNIKNLIGVLKSQKSSVLNNLKKEMKLASRKLEFEKAGKIKKQIMALETIIEHAKIFKPQPKTIPWPEIQKKLREILKIKKGITRIEAYDVSNIQGKQATGSMVTFIEGAPDKNFYRKFKIKIEGKPNDVAMIKETLSRRFNHKEWPYPDLILIDGGKPQLNAAMGVISKKIPVVALTKNSKHKGVKIYISGKKEPIKLSEIPPDLRNLLLRADDEAHRFAIAYHKKLRRKNLLT